MFSTWLAALPCAFGEVHVELGAPPGAELLMSKQSQSLMRMQMTDFINSALFQWKM